MGKRKVKLQWQRSSLRKPLLCALCKHPITVFIGTSRDSLTIDHIIPVAAGGNNYWNNLQPAHKWCNSRRGDMSMDEWTAIAGTLQIKTLDTIRNRKQMQLSRLKQYQMIAK